MQLHILGIGGTFMCGVALLAKAAGYIVTGSDLKLYPPMSTQLAHLGIVTHEGYQAANIASNTDLVIVGNVIKRGNEAMEYVLSERIPYVSGPAWLFNHVLQKKHVLAVAGTHGKTTTSSLLTWILEVADFNPGFLIGGIPENFGVSAHLSDSPYFVIEADEYDSAFFDKRSKFIHYHPHTLLLNNLEYDHADIFPDLGAIELQFHYLIRTIPANGKIIYKSDEPHLREVLQMGSWSETIAFGSKANWQTVLLKPDGSAFSILHNSQKQVEVEWNLLGLHNVSNALAASIAACELNIPWPTIREALATFKNVKRRLEVKAKISGITIYDDFAHHPTAISTTLAGLRARIGSARLVAVLEFGSYTMRQGIHKERLVDSLQTADLIFCKMPEKEWGIAEILKKSVSQAVLCKNVDDLLQALLTQLKSGDHVVIMSNSSFDDIHQKLINVLSQKELHHG